MINKKYIYKVFQTGLLACLGLLSMPSDSFCTDSYLLDAPFNANCNLSVEVSINKIPTCNQTDGSVNLIATGGTGIITYSWGESGSRDDLAPGTYCIVVQDEAGCTALVDFTLKAENCPATCNNFTASAVIEKMPSCGDPNGIVSLSFLGANEPIAYSWGSQVRRTDLTAGNYSVTLVDAAGCTQIINFELTEGPCKCEDFEAKVVIERLPKCEEADGIAHIEVTGANGGITYSWGDSNRRTDLAPGGYWVTVSDAEGCSAVVDFELGKTACPCEFTAKAIIEKNPSCTRNDGSVRLEFENAVGPIRHNLGSLNKYDNLPPGTYNILVSDSLCSVIVSFTLPEPDPMLCETACEDLSLSANIKKQPSCTRIDGSVCIEVAGATGNVTYSWGPNACYDNLTPGVYTVTVTDEVCAKSITFELFEPDPQLCGTCELSATAVINQHPSCGGNDGSVSLVVSNSTGTVTYDWGPLSSYNNLSPGLYSVLITDDLCTYRVNFILTKPDCPTVCTLNASAFIKKQPSCGKTDGMACIQVSGAQGPVTYDWGTENCKNNLAAGIYIVIVTDTVCSDTISFSLEEEQEDCPCTLKGKLSISKVPDCDNPFGSACIDVIGAIGNVTYSWGPDRCNMELGPGSHSVTITDEASPPCTSVIQFIIPDKPMDCCTLEVESLLVVHPNCNMADGSINIKVIGNTDSLIYTWDDIPESVSSRMNLDSGNYRVTITEVNTNCKIELPIRLDKQTLNFRDSTSASCDAKGFIEIMVEGGNENITFAWADTVAESKRTALENGSYMVTITNNLTGCSASKSYQINADGPEIELVKNKEICFSDITSLNVINKKPSQDILFNWEVDDGLIIINPDSLNPDFTASKSDTSLRAFLTVTFNGCTLEETATLKFPIVPDSIDPKLIFAANCRDRRITFKNESKNADLFEWDFGDPTTDSDTSSSTKVTYNYPEDGTYDVILKLSKNKLECSDEILEVQDTQRVVVGMPQNLKADFTYDKDFPCEDQVAAVFKNISTSSSNSNYSFIWSYGDNAINDADSISLLIDRGKTLNLSLEVFDSTGLCRDTFTEPINLPPVEIISRDTFVCENDTIALIDFINDLPATYIWVENDYFDVDEENPMVSLEAEEDFDLISTVENECKTIELTIIVGTKPDYEKTSDQSLCLDTQTTSIGVATSDNTKLIWFVDSAYSDIIDVSNPFEASIGNYYFQLSANNCTLRDSIIVSPGMLDITPFGDTLCEPGLATIGVNNNNPDDTLEYIWTPDAPNMAKIEVPVSESIDFNVLVLNQSGCESMETISVMVADTGFAKNYTIVVNPEELATGEIATLNFNPMVPDNYEIIWSPHPTLDTTVNPVEVRAEECTTYSADLAERTTGCRETVFVIVNPGCIAGNLFFPNAFSPNGDEKNDEARVRGISGFEEMELIIFNRWGQKVFESTNPDNGWDGTFKGERVTADVYGYHITVKCPSRPPEVMKGNVTVLK